MKPILSILSLLFAAITNAQPQYLQYHHTINRAELAICDSNFTQANLYYKQAFSINPDKPFNRDLCNAFHAAMDAQDYPQAERCFIKLLKRGIGNDYLTRIKNTYHGEALALIGKLLQQYANDTVRKNPMAAQIHKMVKWDQDVRNYYAELYNGAYMVDSTFTVDDSNAHALYKLFSEKGFPNENILGSNMWQEYSPVAEPEYNIIILHNTGAAMGRRQGHIFDTMMYKALVNLDYHPSWFGEYVQKTASAPWFKYNDVVVNFPLHISGAYYKDIIYPEYFDEASEKRMNEERAKTGMEPLDDFRRKIAVMNAVKQGNSTLSKYTIGGMITVLDLQNEDSLRSWLAKHGRNAINKPSISGYKYTPIVPAAFDVGKLGDWFAIGEPCFDTMMHWYYHIHPDYYTGKVAYKNWKNRKPPLKWNYHAELVQNFTEDLSTDSGRYNYARFVPGYKMLMQHGSGYWFGNLYHTEELYDEQGVMIYFAANTDTVFYKTMTKYINAPTVYKEYCDTVQYPLDKQYSVLLKHRTYTWIKGKSKTKVVLTDEMDEKGRKNTRAFCYMYHTDKYAAYLQKVASEKKKLDAKYALKKN